jgi:co-chaperonin GroES (HSP10)
VTNLQPIGNRIMVEPIPPADETDSGIVLVTDPVPATTGRVIALGTGFSYDLARLREAVQEAIDLTDNPGLAEAWRGVLTDTAGTTSEVVVGDLVLFSWQAGQEVTIDGERVILLHQDDVLAVLEEVE